MCIWSHGGTKKGFGSGCSGLIRIRISKKSDSDPYSLKGRIRIWLLNNNISIILCHVILKCQELQQVRVKYNLIEGISLQKFMSNRLGKSDDAILRDFLGGLRETLTFYMDQLVKYFIGL